MRTRMWSRGFRVNIPAMIHVDLSNVIPRRTFTYIAAFLPGLFFEVSILFGNPELVRKLVGNLRQTVPPNRYVEVGLVVFLAYVIGTAFMLLVTLFQFFMTKCFYWVWEFLREAFFKWPLVPLMNWLMKKKFWVRHSAVWDLYRYTIEEAHPSFPSQELRDAWKCWQVLARKLLKTRYGVDFDTVGREWAQMYWTIGTPTAEELGYSILMHATHAIGWCGLLATRLAPGLRNRYYFALCILLVITGLHHQFFVANRTNNPLALAWANTRALLREYGKIPQSRSRGPSLDDKNKVNTNGPEEDAADV